jgi:multidrug efflux system membrane fusion protein
MRFDSTGKALALGALMVGVIAAGWWFLRIPAPSAAPTAAPITVSIAPVKSGSVPIEMDGIGHVQAYNTVNILPQVSGQIVKIAFTEGQPVQAGDLLVQIDPRTYQAKLEQDQAALAKDIAHSNNAQVNLGRYQNLAKSGAIAAQQVASQASQVAQLQATIQEDKALIDQDKVQLGYTTIAAPIGGVPGFRKVDVGNIVSPTNTQPLLTLTQVQPIAVLFTLPQTDLPAIQARRDAAAKAQAGLSVEAWSQDGTKKLDVGTLDTTANTVNASTGTITVKAIFPNAGNSLWPGQFVEARLITDTRPNGLTIPTSAVQHGTNGTFVWVVTAARTAEMRPVGIAQTSHGAALIDSGLQAGEQVVTDGQYGLRAGAAVAVVTAKAGASPALKNTQTDTLGIAQ